jgi:hypothetical protein
MRHEMIVLTDRNFASRALLAVSARPVRTCWGGSRTAVTCRSAARLPDGSYLLTDGPVEVRVLCCEITIATSAGARSETYKLVISLLDPDCPATEIVRLYHDRWEIETVTGAEIDDPRCWVLRARTPRGVKQEVYALLVSYQHLPRQVASPSRSWAFHSAPRRSSHQHRSGGSRFGSAFS